LLVGIRNRLSQDRHVRQLTGIAGKDRNAQAQLPNRESINLWITILGARFKVE